MRRRPRLTYANVVSTLALFVALGGGAYAAATLPRNSVGTAQIRNGAVTAAKLGFPLASASAGPTSFSLPSGFCPAGAICPVQAEVEMLSLTLHMAEPGSVLLIGTVEASSAGPTTVQATLTVPAQPAGASLSNSGTIGASGGSVTLPFTTVVHAPAGALMPSLRVEDSGNAPTSGIQGVVSLQAVALPLSS